MNLVDLAGSERIAKTGASGKLLEEAKKINLSLTSLGLCINKLTEGSAHVPFRDSKLTYFLKESLGGNSKTTLVCTASKQLIHLEESLQTLQFARRAKRIKNKAVANALKSPAEMNQLIRKLKEEVAGLRAQLSGESIRVEKKDLSGRLAEVETEYGQYKEKSELGLILLDDRAENFERS